MTGPEPESRPGEPTFADVMNGFSFDSGRSSGRRRWGRRRQREPEQPAEEPIGERRPAPSAQPDAARKSPVAPYIGDPADQPPVEGASSAVRPYAWTRGRTKSGYELEIETLVSTSPRGRDQLGVLQFEHRAAAELCEQTRSVAEVAALLSVPLGVAKVLLGDMAGLGLVVVHQTTSGNGDVPDLALMERVLSGLRRL